MDKATISKGYKKSLKEKSKVQVISSVEAKWPLIDYLDLKTLRKIEIHKRKVWQAGVECGCMVVLRYWQLFHGKPYILHGEKAREQVLKYYEGNNNRGAEGAGNCDEEQSNQIRPRTALTRKGSSFRMLGCGIMKRL
eukprot:g10765.t1